MAPEVTSVCLIQSQGEGSAGVTVLELVVGMLSGAASVLLTGLCLPAPGLPLHCLHDLRLPHARQTLLHPGPDER